VHVVGGVVAGRRTSHPDPRAAIALVELGRPDIVIVVGGVIPPADVSKLREMVADAVSPDLDTVLSYSRLPSGAVRVVAGSPVSRRQRQAIAALRERWLDARMEETGPLRGRGSRSAGGR
jgi:hypothetical protein